MFRYSHGLKDSTSWGCQNITHGHYSFLQFKLGERRSVENGAQGNRVKLFEQIRESLDNTMFIRKENVVLNSPTSITVGYKSRRSKFSIQFDPSRIKHTILETETTVEYLAAYVEEKWGAELKAADCVGVYISEGLSKGAYVEL